MYSYIVILIFAAFALIIPTLFILSSKLLGNKYTGNKVKNAPYESAEATIGSEIDIDNEYLPYFAIFLPFEIITVIIILLHNKQAQTA